MFAWRGGRRFEMMSGQRSIFVVLFLLATVSLFAQSVLPDSLVKSLPPGKQDDHYVDEVNAIATKHLRTDPASTRALATYALNLASKIKYPRGYARALTVIGNSYWYEGIYEFAQNYYLLAARQYQSISDSLGLGQAYNNIGEIYKKLNEPGKALEYLTRSVELIKKDSASRALILYNIGEIYIQMNDMHEARKFTEESMRIATAQHNTRVIAFNCWNFGDIKRKEKNYDASLHYYTEAEELWQKLGELRSLIQTYQGIAEIYREKGQYDESEKYLNRAIQLATQMKVADLQVTNYLRFFKLDSLRGNYSRALYFLSRHNSLKDSVYNLLKAEQIARLQTIYETERRDQENQQLRSDQQFKDAQLRSNRVTLIAISTGLLLAGILAWILYRQRKKIFVQKEAIEMQAVALLKLNEELQELNKNLEARITERTSQLTVQNQRLTEYTFINAHKLRAPVASILGLINLLHQVTPEEREAILGHLKTCGEQLDTIIREVSRNLEAAIVKEHLD